MPPTKIWRIWNLLETSIPSKIILKDLLGKKFKIIGAVTQLGLMSCDSSNWNDKEIRKNPFFCPDKKSVKMWENI